MTLCIAWKHENRISFASDSRASINDSNFDGCVKVSSIPITIKLKSDDSTEDITYNCGIAVSGSTLTAFSLISNISQILRRMSIFTAFGDFNIIHTCDIIQTYFEKLTKQATSILSEKGQLEFFYCGYCFKESKTRCFRFSPVLKNGIYEYEYKEILKSNGETEFIGSGTIKSEKYYNNEKRHLYLLRKIIEDNTIKSVGGPIQYGRTNELFFNTLGIVDYEINHVNKTYYSKFYLNGFELIDDPRMLKADSFHIEMNFAKPFGQLINELNRKGYSAIQNPNAN